MEQEIIQAKKRIFSGIQPTGNLTLGNYIGALRNFSILQDEYDCLYSIVDMHAITVRQNPAELRQDLPEAAWRCFMASGLDPDKSMHLFPEPGARARGARVGAELLLPTWANCTRMTQFKDKAAKHADNINAGLFTYPVLMAADILLYQTDLVPVGVGPEAAPGAQRATSPSASTPSMATCSSCRTAISRKVGARIMSLAGARAQDEQIRPGGYLHRHSG